ncbi:MAG: hypothetical protein A2075_09145 [Geobacteraceae bacterium GWC2_58_44]|nr:MAG: hypothetical protein A2075_09145 [Geobacteraceae bacterium GWC2_58_44]HBG07679.1 hypothetical protein [Geobacter sp.]
MDLAEKDAYIAKHLMKLEPGTLRFMVADLTSEVLRLTVETHDMQAKCTLLASWNDQRAELERLTAALQQIIAAGESGSNYPQDGRMFDIAKDALAEAAQPTAQCQNPACGAIYSGDHECDPWDKAEAVRPLGKDPGVQGY